MVEVLCLPLAEATNLTIDDNVGTQGDQLTVGLRRLQPSHRSVSIGSHSRTNTQKPEERNR
ncbi:hypothetical protein ABZP36_019661 [Zizania latifolia]